MARITLTAARVRALRPRKSAYDTRDSKLTGFGVRVLPSGRKRFFIHCQHRGERVWRVVGDANTMSVGEARRRAGTMLTAIRRGEDTPPHSGETLFEAVAVTVFERYQRVWKARTLEVNRGYLRNQILPCFSGRPVADVDSREVRNWFASLRATPAAADRSMPVLSVIMREAEAMGLRPEGSNPCRGIRRYRRQGTRTLPVRRRDPPPGRNVLSAHAGRQAATGRGGPPSSPDRMPEGRDIERCAGPITAKAVSSCATARQAFILFPGQSMPFSDKRVLTDCDIYE